MGEHPTLKLFVLEDHPLTLLGIEERLRRAGMNICGSAASGTAAVPRIHEIKPDLLILDISLADMGGIDLAQKLRVLFPDLKIIVFTMHCDREYLALFLSIGISGYVLKDDDENVLVDAIRSASDGIFYLSPKAKRVLELTGTRDSDPEGCLRLLTPVELQELKYIASGYHNQQIADILCCSIRTVEGHREALMKKLDIHTVAGLTKFAIRYHLVELD